VDVLARWCDGCDLSLFALRQRGYLVHFAELRGTLAPTTLKLRLFAHRRFYAYRATLNGYLPNPTAGMRVKVAKRRPKVPYSMDGLRALLAACENGKPTLALRNRALLLMYIGTAARRCEILNLRTEDIDWEGGYITVLGKGAKERRLVPGRAALAALKTYLNGREGHVWLSHRSRPLGNSSIWKVLKKIATRAGVSNAYFHRFRHTYAIRFLKESRDFMALKMILGHESYDMVEEYVEYEAAERALAQQRRLSLADRL